MRGVESTRAHALADARAIILLPIRTKLFSITTSSLRMITQQEAENSQLLLNACVLIACAVMAVLIVTHYSSQRPSASQSARLRGYVNPFFCPVILVEDNPGTALKSNPTESYRLDHPGSVSRSQVLDCQSLDVSMVYNLLPSPTGC